MVAKVITLTLKKEHYVLIVNNLFENMVV